MARSNLHRTGEAPEQTGKGDNTLEHRTDLTGERAHTDAPDLNGMPIHPKPSPRDVPVRSPTGGGTDWSDNMRRSRPTYKGKRVPGQHRG